MKTSNTNSERIRILQYAVEKGNKSLFSDLEYSHSLYVKIRAFLPLFVKALKKQETLSNIVRKRQIIYKQAFDTAKMYISHFIIVMNLAVMRNKHSMNIRKFYGLKVNEDRVPEINTKDQLIKIGKQIIEGEHKRTQMGATPILNPTISVVEVYFNKFLETSSNMHQLDDDYIKCNERVIFLQTKAEQLLQSLFQEILVNIADLPSELKQEKLSEWGLSDADISSIDKMKDTAKLIA